MKYILMLLMQLLFSVFSSIIGAAENTQRQCLILLDQKNSENVGRSESWFLMTRLQSAIEEQSTPILLNTALWNSFIERRTNFVQKLQEKDSPHYKTYHLYQSINEKMEYWSKHFNASSRDIFQNKKLVIQNINQEFYNDKNQVTDENFQLLLNYYTQNLSSQLTKPRKQ